MIKSLLYTLLFLTVIACTEKAKEDNNTTKNPLETHQKSSEFILAAHYFASAWPKTFWQEFEEGHVDTDLEQIKNDGFNTIILVLPWVGFESGFENKYTTSNPKMYKRLQFLLEAIKNKDLNYILRLGFPHDYTPNTGTNITDLCTNMYEKPEYQNKWKNYLNKVKKVTDKYTDNLSGVLVSWEDFWCPHFIFPLLDENRRKQLAQNIGYSQWMMEQDKTLLSMILSRNEIKQVDISIPTKDQMAYYYYLEFIDKKFDELILTTTQSVFPQTGMEIRTDKDPVKGAKGENIWIGHNLYFDEPNHRGTYWAPFWGAENNGEKLTIEQALFNFEYFLNYVTDNGKSTNHVIEQFNFTDNTPYFPHNASLNDENIEEFLIKTIPLLQKYTAGYGVWAYRDYADNALYNASFEFGLDGWQHSDVNLVKGTGDRQIEIRKGGFISQAFNSHQRLMLARTYKEMNLCFYSETKGSLDILANGVIETTLELTPGKNCFTLKADNFTKETLQFKLMAQTDLIIDEIKLYGFVQKLGVYNEFNHPGPNLKAIQELNKRLPDEVE